MTVAVIPPPGELGCCAAACTAALVAYAGCVLAWHRTVGIMCCLHGQACTDATASACTSSLCTWQLLPHGHTGGMHACMLVCMHAYLHSSLATHFSCAPRQRLRTLPASSFSAVGSRTPACLRRVCSRQSVRERGHLRHCFQGVVLLQVRMPRTRPWRAMWLHCLLGHCSRGGRPGAPHSVGWQLKLLDVDADLCW